MGDVHRALGCPTVLKLEYGWLQRPPAASAVPRDSSAQQPVGADQPPAVAVPPQTNLEAQQGSQSSGLAQRQAKAPVLRLRLPSAPAPAQGFTQQAAAAAEPAMPLPQQQATFPALAAAEQSSHAAAAPQQQHAGSVQRTPAPQHVQKAQLAPDQARAPPRKKPRRIRAAEVPTALQSTPVATAAGRGAAGGQAAAAGTREQHGGMQALPALVPNNGEHSLFGGQNTCEAFHATWGLGSLPAAGSAALDRPNSRAAPAVQGSAPAAGGAQHKGSAGGQKRRAGIPKRAAAAAEGPAAVLHSSSAAERRLPRARAKPKQAGARCLAGPGQGSRDSTEEGPGALHSILCGGAEPGLAAAMGDVFGGGDRSHEAFGGVPWSVGDAPTSFAGIAELCGGKGLRSSASAGTPGALPLLIMLAALVALGGCMLHDTDITVLHNARFAHEVLVY